MKKRDWIKREKLLARAVKLREKARALELVKLAMKECPLNDEDYVVLAAVYANAGFFDKAMSAIQRAIDSKRGEDKNVERELKEMEMTIESHKPWHTEKSLFSFMMTNPRLRLPVLRP